MLTFSNIFLFPMLHSDSLAFKERGKINNTNFTFSGKFPPEWMLLHFHSNYFKSRNPYQVLFSDHIKYAGMFLKTSYFDRINDVDINNLAGYEERTRVHY